jgi:hypothetical protein
MANQEKSQFRTLISSPILGWGIVGLLTAVILFGGGFLAGRLQQISLYQSRVETIADINSCHP